MFNQYMYLYSINLAVSKCPGISLSSLEGEIGRGGRREEWEREGMIMSYVTRYGAIVHIILENGTIVLTTT